MRKIKLTAVFGTRPEAIKMCPLILELKQRDKIDTRVCITGQHRDMVRAVTEGFGIVSDADLDIMTNGQTLFDITERTMRGIREELSTNLPDILLVHGDTSSAFAAALAAFYMQIPVGHVEAGLRTGNIRSPFPEEFNRRAIDEISDMCFCPTVRNMQNLLAEGKPESSCFVTGNTVIDAVRYTANGIKRPKGDRLRILMTVHRRESLGSPIRSILRGVLRAAQKYKNVEIIFPVHPNPAVRKAVYETFKNAPDNIRLTEPMEVFEFHRLLAASHIVLTDSGGIQEEACALGVPIILARDTTERPEAAESGGMLVAGVSEENIFSALCKLIENEQLREKMSLAENPFGDGKASQRIADLIISRYS